MIKSFRDAETEKVFNRRFSRRLPNDVQAAALRKLRMLANAHDVIDLRSPPGNRLERLAGDRAGQYSICINDQWRVCFVWEGGDAHEVEICDYH
jgi:proteic killer suppression protein